MRISTSQIFEQQTYQIDFLNAEQAIYGEQLSSGKSLNLAQDNPSEIAEDVAVRSDFTVQTQVGSDLSNAQQQLTSVDSALSSVTNVLQSARSLAVEAASGTNTPTQLADIATQVQQLLQETVGFANAQYAGQYVFAGTASPGKLPVALDAAPANPATGNDGVVQFNGNNAAQTQVLPNGTTVNVSSTMQEAFNFNSANGTPDVFQVLQNLYSTLQNQQVTDQSATSVNVAGMVVSTATTLQQLGAGPPQLMQTPLTLDNAVPPSVSIQISDSLAPNGVTITAPQTDTIAQLEAAINAQTATTGISATFNYAAQRFVLSSTQPGLTFQVQDVPSPGATTSSNFTAAFGLTNQADIVNDISTQLGDIDQVTAQLLSARAGVGASTQQVQSLAGAATATINNDTTLQSNIEDTDIAKVTTEFTATQTALQAAYATTTKLEQKSLFDYLS